MVEDVARTTGQVRLYYRRPDQPKIRIWPSVEQEGFWPAYEAAKRGEQLPKPAKATAAPRHRERTFGRLCDEYFASAAFQQLAAHSQRARRGILNHCCGEETKVGAGLFMRDVPLVIFGTKHVQALRDRKAGLPEAANNRVKAIRGLFAWHQEGQEGARNPCAGLKKIRPTNAEGFHAWTLEEVAAFEKRHPVGTPARLAFDLALYTAQRRSDVVRLGPQHVTLHDGVAWLSFGQQKTQRTGGRVEIPIIEPLAKSIAARPVIAPAPGSEEAFLMTSHGRPFTAAGIGDDFRQWCDEAGLLHCTMHGLRKATASRLAELGIGEDGIGAVTGHVSGKDLARYTRAARRRLMAADAMARLQASLERSRAGIRLSHPVLPDAENGTIAKETTC